MTYREGAYVVDTRSGTLAQVVGSAAPRVQVRPPGGGQEWDVPADALRLATRQERETAGIRAVASASPVGCTDCTTLEAERRQAVADGHEDAITDATVAVRSHFRTAHLLPAVHTS
ncbi:hypothetical protein [Streptomyces cinnamoneus]|uniref:Uncharacterized protein n=1 Tax=Streptomyces cinnamoneus TaxID=53446 RepID=A0A918U104_STRCJ|nr:hypothetical protein [Streptomyces cinnamoneus]GHC73466.1 hypothetical protein GCM10010507_60870 [Streptomyces cinnamoneus]